MIVPAESGWSQAWIQSTHMYLSKKKSATKNFVRVIFVADPSKLWESPISESLLSQIDLIQLHPWSHSILDRWLDDNSFSREQGSVSELLEASGGWGSRIQDLAVVCGDQKHLWRERLIELASQWPKDAMERNCLQLPAQPEKFLKKWVSFDMTAELGIEDLVEFADGGSIERLIDWAATLFYVESGNDGNWKLNPLVARSLETAVSK